MANQLEVKFLKKVDAEPVDKTGHTYIHFGGSLKKRLVDLAKAAGYTRKLNEFGVHLMEQAIALAEDSVKRQRENAAKGNKS